MEQQKFRVEGRCPVLLTAKVAVVRAADREEAKEKALEKLGRSTFIDKVEEYEDGEQDET